MDILCGLGKSHCLYSYTWWVLHTQRILDWMIQKKNSPFICSLMWPFIFPHLSNHTCLQSSTAHSTFLMNPYWIQPSYGGFNSHIGGCDNVTLGLLTHLKKQPSSLADLLLVMRAKTIREHWISASVAGICTTALLSKMYIQLSIHCKDNVSVWWPKVHNIAHPLSVWIITALVSGTPVFAKGLLWRGLPFSSNTVALAAAEADTVFIHLLNTREKSQ